MQPIFIVLLTCSAVFFIIALPTFLCGCDKNIQPNCIKYWVRDVTFTNYTVDHRTCSDCIVHTQSCRNVCSRSIDSEQITSQHNLTIERKSSCHQSCSTICSVYRYYDCYDSYAVATFELHGNNQTCSLTVDSGNTDRQNALADAQTKYPFGSSSAMFIDKVSETCFTEGRVRQLAVVGLVFFCLCATCVVLFIFGVCYSKCSSGEWTLPKRSGAQFNFESSNKQTNEISPQYKETGYAYPPSNTDTKPYPPPAYS